MSRTTSQCWHVVRAVSREAWHEDMAPCRRSEAAARVDMADVFADYAPDPPAFDVEQRPCLCVAVQCDGCGADLESDEGVLHAAPKDVDKCLESWRWATVDGRDLCEDCADCAEDIAAPSMPGPLDQPLPGLEPAS